jgi:hypothetical protein
MSTLIGEVPRMAIKFPVPSELTVASKSLGVMARIWTWSASTTKRFDVIEPWTWTRSPTKTLDKDAELTPCLR